MQSGVGFIIARTVPHDARLYLWNFFKIIDLFSADFIDVMGDPVAQDVRGSWLGCSYCQHSL